MVRGLTAAQWLGTDNRDELAHQLAQAITVQLSAAIAEHGTASLVVSGGSTPLPLFVQLRTADLDWSAISVTLADERWVPLTHEDSNASFVKQHLLVGAAAEAEFVSLYRSDSTPEAAIEDIDCAIANMPQPFTVVVLGMGEDGHTASLFPKTAGLDSALSLDNSENVVVMAPSTVPQVRISLTRRALLRSRYRYLHITGHAKRTVLEDALDPDASSNRLPIASFFEKHVPPMSVYWSP